MHPPPGAGMVRDAGQPDDAAAAALDHLRRDRLGQDEGAIERDRQNLVPLLQIHLQERGLTPEPGIVDRDIDAAEFRNRGPDHRRNLVGLRHIGQERHCLAAGRADLLRRLLDDRPIAAAVDDNSGAVGGQRQGDRLADVLAGPCNDRDLAGQRLSFGHRSLSRYALRATSRISLAPAAIRKPTSLPARTIWMPMPTYFPSSGWL